MSTTIGSTTLYCREPERWRKTLVSGGQVKAPNDEVIEIPHGTVLPMRWKAGSKGRFVDGLLEGGVIDANGEFVAGLKRRLDDELTNRTCIGGYEFDQGDLEYRDESVVYGGVLAGAWGHMLVDATSRLWYAEEARKRNLKVVFSIIPKQTLAHPALLNLAGLSEGDYEIIERPTQFKNVFVPATSVYLKSGHFTRRWTEAFDTMRKNALAEAEPGDNRPRKVYLSRTRYKYQNVVGEEYFERFFSDHGFTPVYLEQLPLAEQIAVLANAESVATTMGTLAHMALFCKDQTELIILNRSRTVVEAQAVINNARHLRCKLVDAYASFLPDRQSTGCPVLLAPGHEWDEFARDYFGENPDPNYRSNEFPAFALDYIGKWGDFYAGQWGFSLIRDCGIGEVVALTNEVLNDRTIDPKSLPEPRELVSLRAEVARLRMQVEELSEGKSIPSTEKRTALLNTARVSAATWNAGTFAIGGTLSPTEEAEASIALAAEKHEEVAALVLIANGFSERLCPIKLEFAGASGTAWSAAMPERDISRALSALYSKAHFDSALLAIRIELIGDLQGVDLLPIGSDCAHSAAHSFWKRNIRFGIHAARTRWDRGGAFRFDTIHIKDLAKAVRKRLR